MLAHRLRRWANIETTLIQRLVFTGKVSAAHLEGSSYHTVTVRKDSLLRIHAWACTAGDVSKTRDFEPMLY